MQNLKAEKTWLSHYIAGRATADWLVGACKRPIDIPLSHLLETDPETAARKVGLMCEAVFSFRCRRVDPEGVAVDTMWNSFVGLAGVGALANQFGETAVLPSGAVDIVVSDLASSKSAWRAVTSEDTHVDIFEQVLDATFAIFRIERVQDCVRRLATRISKSGSLNNSDYLLDKWFSRYLYEIDEFRLEKHMPVENIFREVKAKHHRQCSEGPTDASVS
jgi:hypothetical protein